MTLIRNNIYLNAGHSLNDPGASYKEKYVESPIVRKIRDFLIPILRHNGFNVLVVPDTLDLRGSINWVNTRAKNIYDGLALAIHINCCGGSGVETYYYKDDVQSQGIATKLGRKYAKEAGMTDRGAKSSSSTRFGTLGWIEKTNPWALLLECGFIDNKEDMRIVSHHKAQAIAIAKGVCDIYGMMYKGMNVNAIEHTQVEIKALKRQLNLLWSLVGLLKKLLLLKRK